MNTKTEINEEVLAVLSEAEREVITNLSFRKFKPNLTDMSKTLNRSISTIWDRWRRIETKFDIEVTVKFNVKK